MIISYPQTHFATFNDGNISEYFLPATDIKSRSEDLSMDISLDKKNLHLPFYKNES